MMDPNIRKYFEEKMNEAFRKLTTDIIPTDETEKNRCADNVSLIFSRF